MPAPTTPKIEVEFVVGAWTDVTADVDGGPGWTYQLGRASPNGSAMTSALTFTLRNPLGKYTPGSQMLGPNPAGVRVANTLYPNIATRRRVRASTATGTRWMGFVSSWSPTMTNGMLGVCQVVAVDRLDQLSRVFMDGAILQEVGFDTPSLYWPLTEPAGALNAVEVASNNLAAALWGVGSGAGTVAFGDTGPGFGDGTGAVFAPGAQTTGRFLAGNAPIPVAGPGFSVEVWVNGSLPAWGATSFLGIDTKGASGGTMSMALYVDAAGHVNYAESGASAVASGNNVIDGGWHHVAVTAVPGTAATLYVDGTPYTGSAASGLTSAPAGILYLTLGDSFYWSASPILSAQRWQGHLGQVAIYNYPLSPDRIGAHFGSGMGWVGETVDARIRRFLGYAGLDDADMNLDSSGVTLGTYPQAGKDIASACQELTATEGGGSVFYVLGGLARFRNRSSRNGSTVALTIDAQKDALATPYTPVLDSSQLVNQQSVNRATLSGTQNTLTAADQASIALNGLFSASNITSYTDSDADALALAQYAVSQNREPGFRLPQIAVDLRSAQNNLYSQLQAVEIGSRIRVTGLPPAASPTSQLDVIVEGWTEQLTTGPYTVTFDTSPADNPDAAQWGSFKWQAQGLILSASITSAATSAVVTSSRTNIVANPSFETNLTGWVAGGTVPPVLTRQAGTVKRGGWAAKTVWQTTGALPSVSYTATCVIGATYTVTAWVYLAKGSTIRPQLAWQAGGFSGFGPVSTVTDRWQQLSLTFDAPVASVPIYLLTSVNPSVTNTMYLDQVMVELGANIGTYIEGTVADPTIPMLTRVGGAYPLYLQLESEIVKISAAPASSTSPQTVTIARAQFGTVAAAHAAGTPVTLYQRSTWAL